MAWADRYQLDVRPNKMPQTSRQYIQCLILAWSDLPASLDADDAVLFGSSCAFIIFAARPFRKSLCPKAVNAAYMIVGDRDYCPPTLTAFNPHFMNARVS